MPDETTISERCETLYNKLNTFVASVISRDVTPKISNLNTEVWGSDTQTGNSRIDTLNTNFNNLDSSITSMESDINNVESDVSNLQTSVNSLSTSIMNLGNVDTGWVELSWSSNFATHSSGQNLRVRRVGKIVQLIGWAKPTSSMTIDADNPKTVCTLPEQFRPEANLEIVCHGSQMAIFLLGIDLNGVVQISRYRFTNSTSATYPSVPTSAWLPFNATWIAP